MKARPTDRCQFVGFATALGIRYKLQETYSGVEFNPGHQY